VDRRAPGGRTAPDAPAAIDRWRLRRAVVGGLLLTAVVAGAGWVIERARLGSTEAAALARVAGDVQRDFVALADSLRQATTQIVSDPRAHVSSSPDMGRTRALFGASAAIVQARPDVDAISVYDAAGRAVAWAGRPSNLPDERITGGNALFVAPGPAGLRLVHIRPITEAGPQGRRLGSVAAEHLLTRDGPIRADNQSTFTFETGQIPVSLRPRYEGAGDSVPPYGFLLGAPGEPPLLEAMVSPASLSGLRQSWRDGLRGLVLTLLALTLLTVAVILREAHEATHSVRVFLLLVVSIIALLTAARLLLALAVPSAWLLHGTGPWPNRLLFRSPADFLATSLYMLAMAALAGDLVERWRLMRRQSAREPQVSILDRLAFWFTQMVAACGIGGILLLHERALSLVVRESGTFGLQFSLHPFDSGRATVLLGLFALNAAAFWAMVTLLRLAAATWWRVRRRAYVLRSAMASIYVAVPLAVIAYVKGQPLADASSLVPAVFAVVVTGGVARWVAPRYRHASQGLRLLVAYFVLAVPSLAFYPAVVALEDAALSDTIARQYTPEVLNHRTDLRVLLRRSLEELDAVPGLNDQFDADLAPSSPPDTDRAYFLWSRTELGRQRLTSSVELYSPDGGLVSRFALNLPAEFLLTDRPVDAGCRWLVFGEAPPSTDDHVLLHAGRAICTTDAAGRVQRTGILLVHVVLDYGTLPFVAAQDPYAALFRPTLRAAERTHGREIGFAVYGWGRTPVYPTAGTAWPISNELLQRLFRTAFQAFWTVLDRGDQPYRVLLSNDRAGIYAIGYALPRPVDHAVALAEIVTLTALTFALLLIGLGLLGRAAGRHPVTGRALLREIRQSFYRKLFLLFVAASVVPVLALAFVTRAYVAGQLREGLEESALRTASAARRVIETVVSQQRRDRNDPNVLSDDVMISVSRIIDQDVNVFVNTGLVATSQRDLFASGLLPTRTPAEAARAITLERQASYVGDERLGLLQYTVAAVPVRDGEAGAILTVPLTLRQQEIEGEIDVLDRRVTLATVLFILLGAAIGYVTAERIADPVNRLTRATGRIARGDLDARIHASTADELRRLVDAFNQMAADLKHQRSELERTNRLAAWADMARQVAHDIKNPLTPIQLSAEHLRRVHKDAGSPLQGVLDGCVDTILSQVALLRQISSEFSSFASAPVARPAPTRLSEVIDEVVAPYRAGLPDNVELVIEESGPLPVLSLDRGLLGRALVNVIENALHAMRGGGTLTLRTSADNGGAVIEISDTGVGMDGEALAHLFEPYFSTKATGTGLGLTIAKRNVELNGGEITVTSEKGRGTTVRISLRAGPPASGGAAQ
jgi:signal transduction histidine kinase